MKHQPATALPWVRGEYYRYLPTQGIALVRSVAARSAEISIWFTHPESKGRGFTQRYFMPKLAQMISVQPLENASALLRELGEE